MRLIVILSVAVIGLCGVTAAPASERQLTVSECATLQTQYDAVLATLRTGSQQNENNSVKGREMKLFQLLSRHCQKPQRDDYLIDPAERRVAFSQSPVQHKADLPESFPMKGKDEQVFVGEQAKAWDVFYQMPSQCRLHQQSRQDFVFCAEDKKRQREAFLQNWQATQAAKTPDTSIDDAQKAKISAAQQAVMASVLPVSQKVAAVLSPQPDSAQVITPARQPDLQHSAALSEQRTERLSDQLSLVWIGALLVFFWMSWLLWRR